MNAAGDDGSNLTGGIDGQAVEKESVGARQKSTGRLLGVVSTEVREKCCGPLDHDGALAQQGSEEVGIVDGFEREGEAHACASCPRARLGFNERADKFDEVFLGRHVLSW